eukprot:TRINITY_DN29963_c0_g2_i1.p2 TRINITY_DN29963_c0_g2~~TRINITY_DN29963_c0_g2_i1.p2  ORF type:complete len:107 (-),score=32.32 TRINITY_DN29963_c0_g2_i1:47-367(-)
MPLVKVFSRSPLKVSATALHGALARIWGVEASPQVMKVMALPVQDASSIGEDVYVDIRAKAKPERTQEYCQQACKQTAALLAEHGHKANVRLELYAPELQVAYFEE